MTISSEQAAAWMARAIRLAERGRASTHPNPRVGCVIVRDGIVVGEGWHETAGQAHAEVHALRAAGERARDADVFVSLEPCSHHGRTPPCSDALIAAGIRKVWVAAADPNPRVAGRGIERLRAAGIEVATGLLAADATALNAGFNMRMTFARPRVTLKLGASLDARTAMASGQSQWITGPAARADVHRLRAEAGAVLTGIGSVIADDPQLSVRDWTPDSGTLRQPDRIVLDSRCRAPASARVWDDGARRYWVCASSPGQVPPGVELLDVSAGRDGSLDLPAALVALADREINSVLVECGPRLAGALLQQGLVDEVILYLAPNLLGHEGRPLAFLPGMERLEQRLEFSWQDARRIGDDLRVTLTPRRAA